MKPEEFMEHVQAPETVEVLAQFAHEANRAYCLTLGDTSQAAWDAAPDWQKDSARMGVKGVLNGNGPEQSHESWLAQKQADGWKYGPVKDAEAKEHPCFVPYDKLPHEQKVKDYVFVDAVKLMVQAIAARHGGVEE